MRFYVDWDLFLGFIIVEGVNKYVYKIVYKIVCIYFCIRLCGYLLISLLCEILYYQNIYMYLTTI